MWKVLIVEDEVFVRESIRETVRWEDFGFTVIGEAGDGVDALEQIRACVPDLVLCDILMPEMNGIELLRQVRAEGLDCRFVMLTCSGEFEYARKAVEYGASNYVLKLSMSVQVLQEVLQKVSVELQERLIASLPQLDTEYQAAWDRMFGEDRAEPDSLAVPAAYQSLSVSILTVLHGDAPFNAEDAVRLFSDCPGMLVVHSWRKYGLTTLFCWTTACCNLPREAGRQLPYPFSMIDCLRSDQLWRGWRDCLRQLDAVWYGMDRGIMMRDRDAEFSLAQTWRMERELLDLFEQVDVRKCREWVNGIWREMRQKRVPMGTVLHLASRWLRLSSQVTNRHHEGKGIAGCTTHEALRQYILQRLESDLKAWISHNYDRTDHPEINKIIRYIHMNYQKTVTVKQLADHVLLAENYVSGLFKKKMGINLIGYLHHVRIEKAKELLMHSELPVTEISLEVGFVNDNYFNKIFKRITGLTPGDYRRTFKRQQRSG